MIKIVVDSTFYLSKEFCEKHGVKVVPLVLRLDGVEYIEGYPGEFQPFFDKISVGKSFPQTACPSPEDFKKVFEEILSEGHEVLALCLSSGLSGTFQSAKIAAQEIGGDNVTVYDTCLGLAPLRSIAERAVTMADAGKTREEITAALADFIPRATYGCLPINLDYLIKGGRLRGLAAIIGRVAHIKPIINLKDYALFSEKKVFTLSAGENYMMQTLEKEIAEDNIEKYYFGYVYDKKYMLPFKQKVLERYPKLSEIAEDFEIGPVIGIHLGPYAYGHMIIKKR